MPKTTTRQAEKYQEDTPIIHPTMEDDQFFHEYSFTPRQYMIGCFKLIRTKWARNISVQPKKVCAKRGTLKKGKVIK